MFTFTVRPSHRPDINPFKATIYGISGEKDAAGEICIEPPFEATSALLGWTKSDGRWVELKHLMSSEHATMLSFETDDSPYEEIPVEQRVRQTTDNLLCRLGSLASTELHREFWEDLAAKVEES